MVEGCIVVQPFFMVYKPGMVEKYYRVAGIPI